MRTSGSGAAPGAAADTPAARGPGGPRQARARTGRATRRPRRRDRRGRGVRGLLAPDSLPLHRTRGEAFDDLVMDAVEELEDHWSDELAALEFAVEDVPPDDADAALTADTVVDRGVPLGRLYRDGLAGIAQPVIVVYRRPIEARATDGDERADLVFMVVVDLAAEFLGRDLD